MKGTAAEEAKKKRNESESQSVWWKCDQLRALIAKIVTITEMRARREIIRALRMGQPVHADIPIKSAKWWCFNEFNDKIFCSSESTGNANVNPNGS